MRDAAAATGNNSPDIEAPTPCRTQIQTEQSITYDQVRLAAERLGLSVSRPMFAAVHRELAGTARGAEVPVRHPSSRHLSPLSEAPGTSAGPRPRGDAP